MAGGLGGAGKTTVLESYAGIDRSQYLTINPDEIKEEMADRGLIPPVEGLSPMEASDLVHEESSYIAKRLARRAMDDGKNVIWDITMASKDSTEERLAALDHAGYVTTGVFVDIPVEVSVQRADARHRDGHEKYRNGRGLGGRYVPPEVILTQADPDLGSKNRRTFESIKARLDNWVMYDNSVDGRAPVLLASGERHPGS
jgi:predicted kinase